MSSEKKDNKKKEIYKDIYQSKFFLSVVNSSIFDIKLPKTSFDKIFSLYGQNEMILPLSFIHFCNPTETTQTLISSTRNINMRSTMQINKILFSLNNFYIIPNSFENLDESEKIKLCPKIKSNDLKTITKKIGMDFSDMINYLSLQITTVSTKESYKTIINLDVYIRIFNNILILLVQFPDKKKFQMTYYSYKTILKMSGIDLDKVFPFFEKNIINNIKREEILDSQKNILYDKVVIRETKEKIDKKTRYENLEIYKGCESFERMIKPTFDDLDLFRNEESTLLIRLIENPNIKSEEKKEEIIVEDIDKKIKEDNHHEEIEKNKEDEKGKEQNILLDNNKSENNKNNEIKSDIKPQSNNDNNINNNENESKNFINNEIIEKKEDIEIKNEKNIKVNLNIIKEKENKKILENLDINSNNDIENNSSEKNKIILNNKEDKKEEININKEKKGSKLRDSISRKLDAVRVIARLNNIAKKKFKIRRAVIVKVEKGK